MIYKWTQFPAAFVSAYYMLKFALPKLQAKEISVRSFTQFGDTLHLNGDLFMYFTGMVELSVAFVLLASLLFAKNKKLGSFIALGGYGWLLCTMIGALLVEYFVRPQPVQRLVTIAVSLILISLLQMMLLWLRFKQTTNDEQTACKNLD